MKSISTRMMFCVSGIIGIVISTTMVSLVVTNNLNRKSLEFMKLSLLEKEIPKEENNQKYTFMPYDMSDYIVRLCTSLGLDSDLCVSILMNENPEFNPDAVHRNENGTTDLGLWQLNDKYLWSVFLNDYWKFPSVEFNPFNWRHNTYIAINLINDLLNRHKIRDDAIMAYNCGGGAVMNNCIPESTKNYLANVKNNYTLLKAMQIKEKEGNSDDKK